MKYLSAAVLSMWAGVAAADINDCTGVYVA